MLEYEIVNLISTFAPPLIDKTIYPKSLRCSLKSFNEEAFLDGIALIPEPTSVNPYEAVNEWSTWFIMIVDQHAPVIRQRVTKASHPGLFKSKIRLAIGTRDEIHRNQGNPSEHRHARNHVTRLISRSKDAYYKEIPKNRKSSIKDVWRHLNYLSGWVKVNVNQSMLKNNEDKEIITDYVIAEEFNKYFASVADSD